MSAWPLAIVACLLATARPTTQNDDTLAGIGGQTIVVAPFRNLSQQAGDAWIGAGIVATVSSDLQNAGFVVLGQRRAMESRVTNGASGNGSSREPDRLETLRALGAAWLVDGTFQRLGDRLRITAGLVDVRTGVVHESTKIDGTLTDLFAAQDRIVAALTTQLATVADGTAPTAGVRSTRPAVVPLVQPVPDPRDLADAGSVSASDVTGRLTLEEPLPPGRVGPGPAAGGDAGQRRTSGFAASPVGARPTTVIGRTDQTPRIDGRLDDAVWETATHITEFVQMAPIEGAPGSEDTEVWMAYDEDNLYFAFYAHYGDPGIMRINRADRDEIRGDDRISVLFDTFLDQQRAYQFTVNGYGVQGDSIVNATGTVSSSSRSFSMGSGGGGTGTSRAGGGMSGMSSSFGIFGDDSWNVLFETGGVVVGDGWTAEMAIPFKSFRYPAQPGGVPHHWGFQITRIIRGKSESQSWAPVSRAVAGQLTQFGVLDGLSDLSRSRHIEILPELTGVQFGSLDAGSGEFGASDPDGELGLGVKYGITPNLTADFTYNPDFSQIESDRPQIETNQRFALFYPEQRPFFLEGQDIFQTSMPLNLVHTRTIVDPRVGAKLTGKVGDTTLGIVMADDEAAGRLDDSNDPGYGRSAQSFIGRARYDLYAESYIGGIVTAREFAGSYSRVGGVDGRFRLGRSHRASFLAVASETRNDLEGQLGGPAIEADFRSQGRNLGYGMAYSSIDPGFRTDTGFVPRVDLRQTSANLSYRWWPESMLLNWGPQVTYLRLYDHAGVLQDEQVQGMASFQFRNNVNVFGTLSRSLERFGEIDFRKNGYSLFGVLSGRVMSIVGGVNWGDGIFYDANPFLGRSTTGNFLVRYNVTSRLRTEITGVFSSFAEPIGESLIFNVKIFRTRTTYQFTERLLLRHILEHNTLAVTLGNNVLLTYRINGGTVAFLGFDDRYQRGSRIDGFLFPTTELQRTNRAFFGKISYLFRY